MKNKHRIFFLFIVTSSLLSMSVMIIHPSDSSSSVLSREDMEIYVQTFLDSYNKELEDNFRSQVRKYFPFYWEHQYLVNATISNIHGAALEFTPWEQEIFQYKSIDTRVELAFFEDVDLNINSLPDVTNYMVIIYTGPPTMGAFITLRSFSHMVSSDTIYISNKARFIEVEKGAELLLSNVIVDERHFHTLVMRGSNELSAWTTEQAKNDAHRFFEIHLYRAFNQSEEFREYLAYPELSELLEEIVWKHLHQEGYDLIAFKEDLEKIRDLARDKYHVNTEFVDEILDYIEKIAMAPSPPPWWEVAPWSWILGGLVVFVLEEVIRRGFKRWSASKRKKSKKRRYSRKKKTALR